MSGTTHQYEIFIAASPESVWRALVDPEHTVRYFHGTRFESTYESGAPFRCVLDADGRVAVDGTIEVADPPRRLVMTWHVLYDAGMAAEPPGRVEWTLTPANADHSVTRVSLRHGDLALSPLTWQHVRLGWVEIIDSLKSLLETGEPLPAVDTDVDVSDDVAIVGQWHRSQAIAANNSTWELLDGRELDQDACADLLNRAHAAAYHWRRAIGATIVNRARAAWLVSRAHAFAGHGHVALEHARRSAGLVVDAGDDAADFDRAYALEAEARALACLGRDQEAAEVRHRAQCVVVAGEEDRKIFESDLAAEPWFGLTAD